LTKSVLRLVCLAIVASVIVLPARGLASGDSTLVKLASAKFPSLTHAERAMLEFADRSSEKSVDVAFAGPSTDLNDPSNDADRAENWPHDRDVRAAIIRWLFVDPEAASHVFPPQYQMARPAEIDQTVGAVIGTM
jgi:hypothetical protein